MTAERDRLARLAEEVSRKAYSPYSGFSVGAALLAADGAVFTGCNVENASYGLTICAERSAVFAAVAAGCRKITAIAIVASGEELPLPCGACRQVLAEFCDDDCEVMVASASRLEDIQVFRLGELLPHAFRFSGAQKGTDG